MGGSGAAAHSEAEGTQTKTQPSSSHSPSLSLSVFPPHPPHCQETRLGSGGVEASRTQQVLQLCSTEPAQRPPKVKTFGPAPPASTFCPQRVPVFHTPPGTRSSSPCPHTSLYRRKHSCFVSTNVARNLFTWKKTTWKSVACFHCSSKFWQTC